MQQKETIFDEEMFVDADTLEGVDVESGKQLAAWCASSIPFSNRLMTLNSTSKH